MDMTNSSAVVNTKSTSSSEFQPPHNIEAEQGLLGALLLSNDVMDRLPDIDGAHFFDALHGQIFEAIKSRIGAGQVADPITLRPTFQNHPLIDDTLTVPKYLGRLAVDATSVVNAPDYARAIIELASRRRLIDVGMAMVDQACNSEAGPELIVAEAERELLDVSEARGANSLTTFRESVGRVMEAANEAYVAGGRPRGLPTGLLDLDKKLGGLAPGNLIVLAGRPGMGKAQPIDAPVLLSSGEWKAIGDLRIGDHLASVDGAASRVQGVYPQGQKAIHRVMFSDGRMAECCAEHLWSVHHRQWQNPKVMQTSDIIVLLKKQSMRKRLWIDLPSGDFGTHINAPIDPWLLGSLIGNGNFTSGGTVRFSTASEHTASELRMAVGSGLVVTKISHYDYSIAQVGGANRNGVSGVVESPLTASLKHLGLFGLKSEDKFIPQIYKSASKDQRTALVRGLLDTDGWVEKHGTVRFCTSSPRLADDFAELVRSIGGICTISLKEPAFTYKGEKKHGLRAFVCNVMHRDPQQLFSDPKKRSRARTRIGNARLTITKIVPCAPRESVCIAVSHPARLYITSDYVVTHNTAMAINIAWHLAKLHMTSGGREGCPVQFDSMEMQADELSARILATESAVPANRIVTGEMDEDEASRVIRTGLAIQDTPLSIDDAGGLTIARLAARARRLKRKSGFGLLVIDYLQLIVGTNKSGNRVQDVTEITVGLKALAKDLGVPIIALSQLSRKVEERSDKRPQLSDLRESGSIEQDADVVLFVFREEYYVERERPDEGDLDAYSTWQKRLNGCAGKGEVIIGKQRAGETGLIPVAWDGRLTKFSNLAISERAMR